MTDLRRRIKRIESLRPEQPHRQLEESSREWLERKWEQARAALDADYRRRHLHEKLEVGQQPIQGCSQCTTDPPLTFDEAIAQPRTTLAGATDPLWQKIYQARLRELTVAKDEASAKA